MAAGSGLDLASLCCSPPRQLSGAWWFSLVRSSPFFCRPGGGLALWLAHLPRIDPRALLQRLYQIFVGWGAFGGVIFCPSSFAFTNSSSAAS